MSDVLQAVSEAMASLAERYASVVRVEGRNRLPASGVIYRADGVIVTSNHVIERDDELRIGLPGGDSVVAELVVPDSRHGTPAVPARVGSGLSAASWVDSEALRVGHLILALGRPGQSIQATLGVVSALGKAWRTGGGGEIDRYLQTDVVMYPGFSGGPLVAADGRIAGVNSSALVRGASVTIPAATAQRRCRDALAHGRMPRGYLGVGLQPVRRRRLAGKSGASRPALMLLLVEANARRTGRAAGRCAGDAGCAAVRQVDDLRALAAGERVKKR
ncbi:MAG: serine protease [Anaerolineales bacterium]|nr:serine protease [Anaerolineales bacterium]